MVYNGRGLGVGGLQLKTTVWQQPTECCSFIRKLLNLKSYLGKNVNQDAFLCPQVRLVSELGKIEGSLQELNKMKVQKDVGEYSIEVIELF